MYEQDAKMASPMTGNIGMNPQMAKQADYGLNRAVPSTRPPHSDGIRGEQTLTIEHLHSTLNLLGGIRWTMYGAPQEDIFYPNPDNVGEASVIISDLADRVHREIRQILTGLRG